MRRPFRFSTWILTLLAAASCETSDRPAPGPGAGSPAPVVRDCDALVAAEPQHWPERLAAVHAHGTAASRHLVTALARRPDAAGAQAAVALLGRIGDDGAARFLASLVTDRGPLAVEAALALGELPAPGAVGTLVGCARDRFADATLRTAAACAAVRLGARTEVADVLRGVMLAGTPAGQDLQRQLGLPDKPRWAYERYLIQRLLRDEAPGEPLFDTDAPWRELERAADRLSDWLAKSGNGGR